MSAQEETIRKLLAKAERTENEAEAAAFFAKAEELMVKWGVDHVATDEARAEAVTTSKVRVTGAYWRQQSNLAYAAAAGFDCRVFYAEWWKPGHTKASGADVTFVGHPSDLGRATDLFASLNANMAVGALAEVRRQARTGGWNSRHVVQRSFMQGYASRVYARLTETRRVATEAAEPSHLPVLRSRSQAVEDFMDTIRLRRGRSGGGTTDRAAYGAGGDAAARANLGGTGVSGGSTRALNA